MTNQIAIFRGKQIRKTIHNNEWWFVIIDVVFALTDSAQPEGYIKDMRRRDPELAKGWGQIATPLLIQTSGGPQKMNCANTEGIFRIIQSIPSPKAEPFKRWLARVGYERVQDISDPERSLNRARAYWQKHQVKETDEYAILTNIIHHEWSGLSVKGHKKYKGLNQQNLRDHMTEAELIFTALAETVKAKGLTENKPPAHKGGRIAKHARLELEQKTGKRVVTRANFLGQVKQPKRLR